MSTIRNPVGPQPPSVYWRRRVMLLLGVIAVIAVIVLIFVRPGAGEPGATKTPAPVSSAEPTESGTPTPTFTSAAGGEQCNPAQVSIAAVTDSNSYTSNEQPLVSMTITNVGSAPCTFDVGTSEQEYIVTSGSDRIWSSKDCQSGAAANPVVLEPQVTQSTTPFAWDRTRSSTSTCTGTRPDAVSGPDGPTYRLQVKLGSIESETTAFRLF